MAVHFLQFLQLIIFHGVIHISEGFGHAAPLYPVSQGRAGIRKVPEVLPCQEPSAEILMGGRRLVQAAHIFQPGRPLCPLLHQPLVPVHHIAAPAVIPGISHPQHHTQSLGGSCIHNTVQLVPGILVVCTGGHAGLEFPPGHHQDNIVKAVLGNAGQLLVHIATLAVPEIDDPVIGIIGG